MKSKFDFFAMKWTVVWHPKQSTFVFACIDLETMKRVDDCELCDHYDECLKDFGNYYEEVNEGKCFRCEEYSLGLPAIRYLLNMKVRYPEVSFQMVCCNCLKESFPREELIEFNHTIKSLQGIEEKTKLHEYI